MDLKSLVEEGGDQELVAMAREELDDVEQMLGRPWLRALRLALLPKDPNDERERNRRDSLRHRRS